MLAAFCAEPPKQPGMEVSRGDAELDFDVGAAAKSGGDCGRGDVPHAGIRDHGDIRLQFLAVSVQERGKSWASDFFLAFDQHRDADRQAAGEGTIGPQRLKPEHGLTLVIHSAARDDPLAVRPVDQHWFERRGGPQVQRVWGLHIVMAVEQQVRRAAGAGKMSERRRMPAGRFLHRGGEAEPRELAPQPLGGAPAVARMVGLSADAGYAQPGE